MIRAFLGIDLPPEVRSALAVQQFLLPLPRRIDPEAMHLTLVFLGDCPEPVVEAAHEGFQTLRPPAFPLALQGLGFFGGPRPHTAWAGVAPSAPLMHLQAKAETIARRAGCDVPSRKFTPHVTLGRFPPPTREDTGRLAHATALAADFRSAPWFVEALTLWRSLHSSKGARYEPLARYPLS
jgi:RNA 2',3'-cyclic 3'-phosphodiesterase